MREILNGNRMVMGTCYYPEHWDKALWPEDLDRMKKAGIEVVRIAEFAWNKFEPEEGRYDFAFFDEFMQLAEEKGMKVIFCTPSATPPAWMSYKYPEILNCDMDGHPVCHGSRRHYNYNSPVYREFCRRLVTELGRHYGKHPMIIGWQIDNEMNCETDRYYSEADKVAFRTFLQKKYGSLEKLNSAWGTEFWNQTYTDWAEIDLPRRTNTGAVNPHRMLDYTRFVSDSVCTFTALQTDILKQYIKEGDFITTNGLFGSVDNHRNTEENLDVMMYDSYPDFAYNLETYRENDLLKDRKWSRNLSETRAISPIFGIMEQQSGSTGWNTHMEAPTPKPGRITLWTMQSIAHGADFISYFRWRTCTFGTEIYWHGILDYSGRDNRRLAEITHVHEMMEKLGEVAGATYKAKVGILKDYDNLWDAEIDRWHKRVEAASAEALFTELQLSHTPFDYVYIDHADLEKLKQYEVLFYPHAVILTKERADLLTEYVKQGGKLVFGCRTGYKDSTGRCVMDKLPGLVAELTGTDIPEYSFVSPEDGTVFADFGDTEIEAAVFNDLLATCSEQATVLASYKGTYYEGEPALIRNPVGKGEAYYFGGAFGRTTVRALIRHLGVEAPYEDVIGLPEDCELAVRAKDGKEYLFVLNYRKENMPILLHKPMRELLSDAVESGAVTMKPYEVKVYAM